MPVCPGPGLQISRRLLRLQLGAPAPAKLGREDQLPGVPHVGAATGRDPWESSSSWSPLAQAVIALRGRGSRRFAAHDRPWAAVHDRPLSGSLAAGRRCICLRQWSHPL